MGAVTVLLDTHTLLWWWSHPTRLSDRAKELIANAANVVLVSAASAWEISTKTRIGKLPVGEQIMATWNERITTDRFRELPVRWAHGLRAGSITSDHRDPFDRMLAAQSVLENVPIISSDTALSDLGADRVW